MFTRNIFFFRDNGLRECSIEHITRFFFRSLAPANGNTKNSNDAGKEKRVFLCTTIAWDQPFGFSARSIRRRRRTADAIPEKSSTCASRKKEQPSPVYTETFLSWLDFFFLSFMLFYLTRKWYLLVFWFNLVDSLILITQNISLKIIVNKSLWIIVAVI